MSLLPTPAAKFHLERGKMFVSEGRYGRAISAFLDAINIQPDLQATYIVLGGVYLKAGNYRLAADQVMRALQIKPVSEASLHLRKPLQRARVATA